MNNHPAVAFGVWLKGKRQAKRIIARVFASNVGLSPAEYAEVEAGVVRWIDQKQENRIPVLLDLNTDETAEFNRLLFLAKEASALDFSSLFTEDQLSPARLCSPDRTRLTPEKRTAILKAVFTPLA